ncbi:MAG: lysophospholipid acyltransferase family protein [Crocinitomicaceae bacterium]
MNSDLPTGPYIIVANHMSYLDIFLLPSILPQERFLFLGKSEILKYPLIKTYFKHLNIPVFRKNPIKAGKSLVKAKKEVRKGWSLVIFPEGGIPDEQVPKMVEFKEGAFQLAKSCRVPIVPITYTNNHRLFSDPSNFLGPARPGISHVYIHPFLKKEEVKELSQKELSDTCFNIVNAPILEQYPHLKD